jgi:phosphoglycerol transferase MdoB-like AlkP superfamily enzyme
VTVFVLLVLFYLTVSLLTTLTLTCKIKESVKTFARGLKRIHHSLRPVVFQFLIFIIINLFIFVFAKLPIPVFVGVTAIMLLAYFAWLRFYDTMVWHKMATSVVEDKPKISAGSKVIKHSVKKKQAKDVMGSFVR